jgi:hypothetical protein
MGSLNVFMAGIEGEGTGTMIVLVVLLGLLLAGIVAWKIIQKNRSVYTYKYGK